MSNIKSSNTSIIQKIGLALFIIGFAIFTAILGLEGYKISPETVNVGNNFHNEAILQAAQAQGMMDREYSSNITFISDLKTTLVSVQTQLAQTFEKTGLPQGINNEWDYKMYDSKLKEYPLSLIHI